ncbi:rod shape-determining protein MreD [Desemzia sp. RIT804]|uniref:rod shape-determining protein MreD n=1 Tax=Desemzia sp. RIT 804 TaxID=2810209 RepID=UPI00195288B7|nr:rod shape-determining protein MreD [Desemzia sp. RIT 804]MBM6613545.1 rod shape-determining protein MreD [Desemzia sp. RIT 804]
MTKKSRIHLFVPLTLLTALLFDGIIASVFSTQLYTATSDMVSRLIIICIVLFSFYVDRKYMILFGILFGLLYDSYYVGILGLYTSLFPIIIYLSDKMRKILNPNLLVIVMILIIHISLIETLLYGFYSVIDLTAIDFSVFLANRLGPTLLLNSIFLLVLYYPVKKLAIAIMQD